MNQGMGLEHELVTAFSQAMLNKMRYAAEKHGYRGHEWCNPEFVSAMRAALHEHLQKGDPVDVANYCAFLWYHGAATVED